MPFYGIAKTCNYNILKNVNGSIVKWNSFCWDSFLFYDFILEFNNIAEMGCANKLRLIKQRENMQLTIEYFTF